MKANEMIEYRRLLSNDHRLGIVSFVYKSGDVRLDGGEVVPKSRIISIVNRLTYRAVYRHVQTLIKM